MNKDTREVNMTKCKKKIDTFNIEINIFSLNWYGFTSFDYYVLSLFMVAFLLSTKIVDVFDQLTDSTST